MLLKFSRLVVVIILLSGLSTLGIACSENNDTADAELIPISIALDWFPWANHSGLYVSKERGYFEEEGLDVNIYVPGDPSTVLQTVAAGKDDFGISYQPEVLIAREQDIPVVSIMAMVQHPLNSVMALKESGIVTPKDLKGKRLVPTEFHQMTLSLTRY